LGYNVGVPSPRILVVDDEESILESICFALEHEGYQAISAASASQALSHLQPPLPDLVLLDVMLPDRSGLELCQYLRALGDTPILMLSARDSLEDRVIGLDSGADDYLVKPFRFKELLARVRALLRRNGRQAPASLQFGALKLDSGRRVFSLHDQELTLTLREYELLEFLLHRARLVVTRAEILNRLWGMDASLETNVLDVHISALRAKLGESGRYLIRTVRGVGYSLG